MSTQPLQVNEAPVRYLAKAGEQDVPPGYKLTEVGVVPEDWQVVCLSRHISFLRNGTNSRADLTDEGPVKYLHYGDIHKFDRAYLSPRATRMPCLSLDQTRVLDRLCDGDVVFVDTSEDIGGIGKSVEIRDASDINIVSGLHTIAARFDKAVLADGFKAYLQFCPAFRAHLKRLAAGTKVYATSRGHIASAVVPLPKLDEQRAIAEALSDVDELLAALEKLIAKKRAIKQAAMQQLLTGKTRLPGFSGPWETKRLGETAILKARIGWQGLTTAEYLDSGDYLLVSGTEFKDGYVDWNNCHYVAESRYKQDGNIQLKEHDVLVTKDGTIGKVALITHLPKPATLNSGIFVIRPIENAFHPRFFYYLLCSDVFTDFLVQLSAGSTINHLYQKDFVGFVYRTPLSLEEQTAIATVLSDMDAEITALEARRDKVKRIKQGMMQQLLTGRIRLMQPFRETAPC